MTTATQKLMKLKIHTVDDLAKKLKVNKEQRKLLELWIEWIMEHYWAEGKEAGRLELRNEIKKLLYIEF